MRPVRTLALLLALIATACGDTATTTTAVPPGTTVPSATTTAPPDAATTTAAVTTTSPPPPPTTTTPQPDPLFDSWTVILASLPVDDFSEGDARDRLAELSPPDGGVLLSSDYPSLNPGFWVVYSGVFERDQDAQNHCATLGVECYHRYLGGAAGIAPTRANGQALLWLEADFLLDLVAVSLEDGAVIRTIVADRGEAEFPDAPVVLPGGDVAVFDIGFEDFWFSCEGVLGDIFQADLETGRVDRFVQGIDPVVSPDGRYLAWSEAPECLEDPVEPQFFIAYHEVIVVRDLRTGEERRWGASDAITGTDAAYVHGKGWSADSERLYFTLDDGLRELRITMPTTETTDGQQLIPLFGYPELAFLEPLGQLPSGELAMRWGAFDEETGFMGGLDLYDLAAGERTTLAETDDFVPAALDSTGSSLAWAEDTRLRSTGEVEIDVDLGRRISGIGW